MIKIKSLFVVLFLLAFLPLVLACGDEQTSQGVSAPINANAVYGNSMMSGNYGMGFFAPLIMVLVIIALVLIIIWLVKQIQINKKGGKNEKKKF